MGAPKQKWSAEEEAALRAGVEKHGSGKWRAIQKDPQFAPCLSSRSNVDLKDKWRNLNVGSSGYGSRSLKVYVKPGNGKQSEEPIQAMPTSCLPPDPLLLGEVTRYENLVVEAIRALRDPNGASMASIAGYIEEHCPVIPEFRRLLNSILRDMVIKGMLFKSKLNFKVNDGDVASRNLESSCYQETDSNRQVLRICGGDTENIQDSVKGNNDNQLQDYGTRLNAMHMVHHRPKNGGRVPASKKIKMDGNYARSRLKTIEAAALAAAIAVAEAEAAALAAEQAAEEAEAAEAEAEAAEIAAEIAAIAAQSHHGVNFALEDLAVTV